MYHETRSQVRNGTDEAVSHPQPNNPLHGVTLERMVKSLSAQYGWAELGRRIRIRCFTHDPSVNSSLTFLRKTPWARKKVEDLYLASQRKTEERGCQS